MRGEPTPLTDGVLFGQSTSLFALVAQLIYINSISQYIYHSIMSYMLHLFWMYLSIYALWKIHVSVCLCCSHTGAAHKPSRLLQNNMMVAFLQRLQTGEHHLIKLFKWHDRTLLGRFPYFWCNVFFFHQPQVLLLSSSSSSLGHSRPLTGIMGFANSLAA